LTPEKLINIGGDFVQKLCLTSRVIMLLWRSGTVQFVVLSRSKRWLFC